MSEHQKCKEGRALACILYALIILAACGIIGVIGMIVTASGG